MEALAVNNRVVNTAVVRMQMVCAARVINVARQTPPAAQRAAVPPGPMPCAALKTNAVLKATYAATHTASWETLQFHSTRLNTKSLHTSSTVW